MPNTSCITAFSKAVTDSELAPEEEVEEAVGVNEPEACNF